MAITTQQELELAVAIESAQEGIDNEDVQYVQEMLGKMRLILAEQCRLVRDQVFYRGESDIEELCGMVPPADPDNSIIEHLEAHDLTAELLAASVPAEMENDELLPW